MPRSLSLRQPSCHSDSCSRRLTLPSSGPAYGGPLKSNVRRQSAMENLTIVALLVGFAAFAVAPAWMPSIKLFFASAVAFYAASATAYGLLLSINAEGPELRYPARSLLRRILHFVRSAAGSHGNSRVRTKESRWLVHGGSRYGRLLCPCISTQTPRRNTPLQHLSSSDHLVQTR